MTDMEALVADIAGTIHRNAARLESATWCEDAALLIVCKPQVRAALEAVRTLELLREAHHPVAWAEGSETIVCAVCFSTAWPCKVIELIDRAEVSAA